MSSNADFARIAAMRDYDRAVQSHIDAFLAAPPRRVTHLEIFCRDATPATKCVRPIARIYADGAGALLFTARIQWLPADGRKLTPWLRRALLVDAVDKNLDSAALTDYLHRLDQWAVGVVPSGPRWLKDGGTQYIRDILTASAGAGVRPELWTRCSDHPGAATRWTVPVLAHMFRSTLG